MREDIAGPQGASSRPMWETLEGMLREKAQEFIQQIMEEEVTELLGREKSERRSTVDSAEGYRNGYGKPRRLAMSSGTITLRRPRVRGVEERFESRVLPLFARRTKELGLEKHQALIVAPVHFAAGARQTAAPWAGARARRRVRAMTKPYGSSLPPALWAINEEAGPSRPSSRTSSRIRRARSPENSAAGRPPRASRGATRGLGRPRSAGEGPPPDGPGRPGGPMDEPSEPRSAAISAAPDPVGSRQSVPRGPSGPGRAETSPSEPVSAAITGADGHTYTPGSSSSRTDWSLSGLASGSRRSGRWKAGPAGR